MSLGSFQRSFNRVRPYTFLAILLALSLVLNLVLARRVASFASLLDAARDQTTLLVGTRVSEIRGLHRGVAVTVRYSDVSVPTLLYVMSPLCGWCEKNLPNIKALSSQAAGRYRVIGLSVSADHLDDYLAQNNLPFPVLNEMPSSIMSEYKLGGTPESILISPQGTILRVWRGAYTDAIRKELEAYF